MRRAESKALKERIAKAILKNDNTLTNGQLRLRFPQAYASMITAVSKSLGIKLPHSEYLEKPEMEPFTEGQEECIERIKMTYWRRGNQHREGWAERWRDGE